MRGSQFRVKLEGLANFTETPNFRSDLMSLGITGMGPETV